MRAAIYVRISRDRVGAGLGVDRQEQDCRKLAAGNGWVIIEPIYVDNDLSASSGRRRPEYQRLLADVAAGRIDAVICWHTDRLHRRPVELESYIDACERHAVATYSVTAGPLDMATASGRMAARMHGAVARYETEHSIERIRAQKRQAIAAGKYLGGPRPYGYESDGMTVRPAEAAELLAMTRDVVAGVSGREIARRLNERGVTTTTGVAWSPGRVTELIRRPRNAGLVTKDGPAAAWPAIVPEQIWRDADAVLSSPSRRTNPGGPRRWIGGGLYVCGLCGRNEIDQTMRRSTAQGGRRVYSCAGPSKHLTRQADGVDAWVEQVIVARLSEPDAVDLFAPKDADTAELHLQANGLRARLDELAEMFADGTITGAQLKTGSESLRRQLDETDTRIAHATRGNAFAAVVGDGDVAARWAVLEVDTKREIIDALCTVVILPAPPGRPHGTKRGVPHFDRSTVEFRWKVAAPGE